MHRRVATLREYLSAFPAADSDAIAIEILGRRDFLEGASAPSDATLADAHTPAGFLSAGGRLGQYGIERELGRGGQGTVYLARDTRLGRLVALKVLDGSLTADEGGQTRFQREALIASKLDHPGICTVYESGFDRGKFYIAMRYVAGESLKNFLARPVDRSRSDRETLLRLVEQLARALHVAHEAGVVHRDLKPGNIMVTPDGGPVILDFGLARLEDIGGPTLTQTGDVFGTPAYMAPEQIRGHGDLVTRQSDVYALGVTLFECLTRRKAFEEATREATYHAILTREVPNIQRMVPGIGTDVRVIVETALAKEPERRYVTAEAFANDLAAVLENRPIQARQTSWFGRLRRFRRREPAKAALAAVLLIGLPIIGALAAQIWDNRGRIEIAQQFERESRREHWLELASQALSTHDDEGAERAALEALKIDPDSPEAQAYLVLSLIRQRNPSAARTQLKERGHKLLGRRAGGALELEIRRLEAADATSALNEADLPPSRDGTDHFLEGLRHSILAVDASPARAHLALESLTMAILLCDGPRAIHFTERVKAAGMARDRRVLEESERVLKARWPNSASAHFAIGLGYERLGAWEAAAAATETALQLRQEFPEALQNLGAVRLQEGRLEEARTILKTVIAQRPNLANAHTNLGNVLHRMGQLTEALQSHDQALRIDPESTVAHNNRGTVLRELGRLDEAIAAHEAALCHAPENASAYLNLGGVFLEKGDTKAAESAFESALRIDPTDAEAQNMLGRLKARRGDYEGAIRAHEAAIRQVPDYAEAIGYLGHCLRQLGRLEEALAAFRRSHELGSSLSAWQLPTGRWIAECERELRSAGIDEPIAREDLEAQPRQTWRGLAIRALDRKQYRRALSIGRAIREHADSEARPGEESIRILCARAAAALGDAATTGEPRSGEPLSTEARQWIREEISQWASALRRELVTEEDLSAKLSQWRRYPEFRALSAESELWSLPD